MDLATPPELLSNQEIPGARLDLLEELQEAQGAQLEPAMLEEHLPCLTISWGM